MLNYSADKIVLALATAIGSVGMMPKPPGFCTMVFTFCTYIPGWWRSRY
jgi:hypothetical protein